MLQRAASNAYSWWWASHIRTKQSKWLEQNLKDMEEKVQIVLKLIEEDGDSFAKRAEMYYKKRPELISFVEESYRAYRALAERYDHISNELQNANNTIASVFPEQVQFSMDEEDEDASSRAPKKASQASKTNVPEAPKGPELKSVVATKAASSKKLLPNKSKKAVSVAAAPKSGLKKPEALEEIDRLQKQILALQTEKEFVKSSYENGLAKYWEIESEIKAMQERVCSLQDEFGEGMVIEDDEARNLMAEAAIKSCQETLTGLQEKLKRSTEEASVESQRIKDVREKFESLKGEFRCSENNESGEAEKGSSSLEQEAESKAKESEELELLRAKIKEQFEVRSSTSFTVTDMVEKIDELVNKVISLETAVSSQAALVERLKTETDELQAQIRNLEGDKASLIDGKNSLSNKLKEMEEKLKGIQVLNRSFKDQSNNLQIHFTEANCNLDHLSDKLQTVRPDEDELNITAVSSDIEFGFAGEAYLQEKLNTQQEVVNPFEDFPSTRNPFEDYEEISALDSKETSNVISTFESDQQKDLSQSQTDQNPPRNSVDAQPKEEARGESEEEPDWQKLFTDGMEEREKILLKEYTSTLRNYKDVKKRLGEAEKKNRDGLFETTQQLRELKSANAKKDEEIRALRLKLGLLEDTLSAENAEKDVETLENAKAQEEDDDGIKTILTDQAQTMSAMEEKFRMNIDELLEQNLEFWLRFSSSFHQIQEFDTEVEDLKSEIKKLQEKRSNQDGNSRDTLQSLLKSDARPLYTHMREIQAKLTVWLEKAALLKDELQCRFSSLCDIQEAITKALKACAEDDDEFFKFTSHQAAKFQGEVLNMKQENNKVADELQAGLDHVAALQIDVERTLARLDEEFELAGSKKKGDAKLGHAESRSRVPLRSFIFGVKQKKQKGSIFSCVTPAMQRKYHGLRAGPPF